MAIEIVDFPMKNGENYQRVTLSLLKCKRMTIWNSEPASSEKIKAMFKQSLHQSISSTATALPGNFGLQHNLRPQACRSSLVRGQMQQCHSSNVISSAQLVQVLNPCTTSRRFFPGIPHSSCSVSSTRSFSSSSSSHSPSWIFPHKPSSYGGL